MSKSIKQHVLITTNKRNRSRSLIDVLVHEIVNVFYGQAIETEHDYIFQ